MKKKNAQKWIVMACLIFISLQTFTDFDNYTQTQNVYAYSDSEKYDDHRTWF